MAVLKRAAAKGLADRVLLKGFADLSGPYARCAFVAFPSKTEGFPLTVIDAAMFSKPTLMIHDWIGCGEVVEPKGFAMSLRKLMADAEYRNLIGRRSKVYCIDNFSKTCILDNWELLLNKLCF